MIRAPGWESGQGVTISFQCHDALAIYREVTAREVKASIPLRRQQDVGHRHDRSRRLQARVREPNGRA